MGISSFGPRSWGIAIVTFEDGEIVDVKLEEAGKDPEDHVAEAELKDEDYAWEQFHEAKEVMPERFIIADDVTQVDNVTEATSSVDKWIEAVLDAKRKAGLR